MENDFSVYFDGNLWVHPGRSRRGTEICINKEFEFAGRRFVIPSVWSCVGGLVVDVIMKVDASAFFAFIKKWNIDAETDVSDFEPDIHDEIEQSNPLNFNYIASIRVNGRTLDRTGGCGISYIPCIESSLENTAVTESVIRHYKLLPGAGFMLMRHHFAWKRRVKDLRSIEITLEEIPSPITAHEFSIGPKERSFSFHDPIANTERELMVVDYSIMNNELRDTEDRSRIVGIRSTATLVYKLEPELKSGDIKLFCRIDAKNMAGTTGGPYKNDSSTEPLREFRIASSLPFSGDQNNISWQVRLYPEARKETVILIP